MSSGQVRRHVGLKGKAFLNRQRLHGVDHAIDDVLQRIVRKRQCELPGLDLRQIEHVVDEPEKVAAVGLNALQHLAHPLRRITIDVVENKLGVAEDGVQWCAQFVAHIGEELRFVFAFALELVALFTDFTE